MSGDALVMAAISCMGAGVAMLRWAWQLSKRSIAANSIAWSMIAAGCILGWAGEGAWGASLAVLSGMTVAGILLMVAALRSPAGKAVASNRRVGMLPERGEPLRLWRRIYTFVIVALLAGLASISVAILINAMGIMAGMEAADRTATALLLMPLVWAVLAFVLLMQATRKKQILTLLICCLSAIPAFVAGAVA